MVPSAGFMRARGLYFMYLVQLISDEICQAVLVVGDGWVCIWSHAGHCRKGGVAVAVFASSCTMKWRFEPSLLSNSEGLYSAQSFYRHSI